MKKYLLGILFLSFLSCGSSDDSENLTPTDPPLPKIQTLTIKDEQVVNGNTTTVYERFDYKFEYNQDKLVKVWDINGNYTENLVYDNDLISMISIVGNSFNGTGGTSPYKLKRKLYYDNSRRLIKSESIYDNPIYDDNPIYKKYLVFEYPSPDVIIVKSFGKNSWNNNIGVQSVSKIYLANGNVSKIEDYFDEPMSMLGYFTTFEYDNKINPNYLVDRSRILGLIEKSYTIYILWDFAQISKNNVVKKQRYWVDSDGNAHGQEPARDIHYKYQNNGFPDEVAYYMPEDPEFKTSATFGF